MAEAWRLLLTGEMSAAENMALDEAVLRQVTAGKSPCTMRFYGWVPSAVTIGYFQGIEQEVDLEACRAHGIDVVRRLTGGGAVYHDREGEITYSLVMPDDYPGISRKVLDSYGPLCAGVVVGLQILGLDAQFHPINDILVAGKKISGNAQTRRFGGILQHGTILCRVDPHLMFTLLKVPNEKVRDKLIAGVEERVTSIQRELGTVDKEAVTTALIEGFSRALDVSLEAGEPSPDEWALAARLQEERYGNDAWNHRR